MAARQQFLGSFAEMYERDAWSSLLLTKTHSEIVQGLTHRDTADACRGLLWLQQFQLRILLFTAPLELRAGKQCGSRSRRWGVPGRCSPFEQTGSSVRRRRTSRPREAGDTNPRPGQPGLPGPHCPDRFDASPNTIHIHFRAYHTAPTDSAGSCRLLQCQRMYHHPLNNLDICHHCKNIARPQPHLGNFLYWSNSSPSSRRSWFLPDKHIPIARRSGGRESGRFWPATAPRRNLNQRHYWPASRLRHHFPEYSRS